MAREACPNEFN